MKNANKKTLLEYITQVASSYEVSQKKVAEIFAETVDRVLTKFLPDRVFETQVDLDTGNVLCRAKYIVVDNLPDGEYDDFNEIPLNESKKYGDFKIGDVCWIDFDILDEKNLPKQQITQILQIFKQKLNEINNVKIYDIWAPRIGEIIYAEVEKNERNGAYIINLENNNFGFLSRKESIPGEELKPGQKYQFLIKDVKEHSKGWPIILSRADVDFVKKLLDIEIPEIHSGEVKINLIKRIAGFKTKIAVSNTTNATYDPAAIVVGPKGTRIKNLSSLINNEKIEVIKYSDNFEEFLLNVCGQNNLVGYKIIQPKQNVNEANHEDENSENLENKPHITLIVEDDISPIIIGKKGFNIKLIAMMLNCSIDISSVTQANQIHLDYTKVLNTQRTSKSTHTSNTYAGNFATNKWSNKSNVATNHNFKSNKNQSSKVLKSNDDLLDDIENLSEDQIKELYNIDIDLVNKEMNKKNNTESNKNEETTVKLEDYEDSDLSDAFADEIANAINSKDEEKH